LSNEDLVVTSTLFSFNTNSAIKIKA
jgi:hypothetical protein